MRVALISDIHANLPALEAVLDELNRVAIDAVYHLGDLIGYAPWPNEVIALVRERGIGGVAGNYDTTVASNHAHCGCKYDDPTQAALSHESFAWTCAQTGAEEKRWLMELPFRLDLRPGGGHESGAPRLVLVHGTPVLNTVYWTEDRPADFFRKMARIAALNAGDVIAFGHTHKPFVRELDGVWFVNTGSVGKPKDGDPRASYVLVDIDDGPPQIVIQRVAYDVDRAGAGIEASELPNALASLLRSGGVARS
jgi:predicted phosphodiesterase